MAIERTRMIMGRGFDPWYNLALEEHLLDTVRPGVCTFYLWQNQNTVVIGKNQNAWRECRTYLLEQDGGKLARRSSGGGAVFHDLGNLNFTFVMEKKDYDLHRQLGVILDAVNSFGLNACFSGRNDLLLDGAKFSGNAFLQRATTALHHGTILLDVDMSKLSKYLQPPAEKMQAKGIESVRSRVTNLCDHADISLDTMKNALIQSFSDEYGVPEVLTPDDLDQEAIDKLYERYSSWEWLYGRTPRFDITLETRFAWGGVEAGLSLSRGVIESCSVYSDAMDQAFIEAIPAALTGCVFTSDKMAERIEDIACDTGTECIREELAGWIRQKGF